MRRLAVLLTALFAGAGTARAQDLAQPAGPLPVRLEGPARALAGDTIELNGYRVRLFGIDAPEMRDARGPVARGELGELLAGAAEVACEIVDQDRHGGPVGRCRAGGRDLGEAMVRDGWAFSDRVVTAEYDAAEADARAGGRGFWGTEEVATQMSDSVVFRKSFDIVAVYAAIVATFVLIWDVIKWARSGPRLRVSAISGMRTINIPDRRVAEKTFVRVRVTNIGSGTTKLTTLAVAHYKTRWELFLRRPANQGVIADPCVAGTGTLPSTLPPGDEWSGFIEQNEKIESWATNGFLFADVYDAVHTKPARARVLVKRKTGSADRRSVEAD